MEIDPHRFACCPSLSLIFVANIYVTGPTDQGYAELSKYIYRNHNITFGRSDFANYRNRRNEFRDIPFLD